MVTLSLLRHAKSSWNAPVLTDIDRPLAPRGEKAAPRIGRFIARSGITPELILCSRARRARQTIELLLPELPDEPEVRVSDELYGAGPEDMLEMIRGLPDERAHVMLVGHNPALEMLAVELAGSGERESLRALRAKFPTGALAVLDFDCAWSRVAPGGGRLRLFMIPKRLPAG